MRYGMEINIYLSFQAFGTCRYICFNYRQNYTVMKNVDSSNRKIADIAKMKVLIEDAFDC